LSTCDEVDEKNEPAHQPRQRKTVNSKSQYAGLPDNSAEFNDYANHGQKNVVQLQEAMGRLVMMLFRSVCSSLFRGVRTWAQE
jgi:hypothetical protein